MSRDKYDFAGWATKYGIGCSDGRTISKGAFAHCDEIVVPLVWNHTYDKPENIIGKAKLVNTDEGVYAYCSFNDTATAETSKSLVKHGDVTSLSIYANHLKQKGNVVMHGDIKEVSLVLAGANPGAFIQEVLIHGEVSETEVTIYNDDDGLELWHEDANEEETEESAVQETEESNAQEDIEHADSESETIADIYNTMSEKQKKAVAAIVDQIINEGEEEPENEEEPTMKHNVFDQNQETELKHFDFEATMKDAKRCGSLKEAFLKHAESYGIKDIESLFPEAKDIYNEPEFIKRDTSWVAGFLSGTHKQPFSKIKAVYADITGDDARALGYVKGNLKKEEVFSLLKRTTEPTTIYKKQKLDRDDIIDITDFNVVAWIKKEMRMMLDEEIARAMLIGDGRSALSQDKIKENCIRPIFNDSDLYTIKAQVDKSAANQAKEFIRTCILARKEYEGTGTPTLYTTEDVLCDLLLIEDQNGRFIYESVNALCNVLRVSKIVTVPVMKGLVRTGESEKQYDVLGIIVNPNDYHVGADKGGQVSMFDDFDIDYNQYKYLMETRCSGSLVKPKTAITIEKAKQ